MAALVYKPHNSDDYGPCAVIGCERNSVSQRERYCSKHVTMRRNDKEAFYALPRREFERKPRKPRSDAGVPRGPQAEAEAKRAMQDHPDSDVFWGKTCKEVLDELRRRLAADRAAGILLG